MIHILHIEDNPADIDLTLEAMSELTIEFDYKFAADGEEGLDYVFKRGKFAGVPRPDLILLDLNLPKCNGYEVLQKIKADEDCCLTPIIVLSSSRDERDACECYRLGASAYVSKPSGIIEFFSFIQSLEDFWFRHASFPASARENS